MSRPIPVVGPRVLPTDGMAEVWIDGGSGAGYVRRVPAKRLVLDPADDGVGHGATYLLQRPVPSDG